MRIADITTFYNPTSGGVKTYITHKALHAKRFGVQHLVIVPASEDSHSSDQVFRAIKSPQIPFAKPYRLIIRKGAVYQALKDFRPDVVEAGCPYMLPWILSFRKALGFKVVAFYHSDFPRAYLRPVSRNLEKLGYALVRRYYGKADLVVAPSRYSKRLLEAIGVKNVEIVPLGVDTDQFRPELRDEGFAQRLLDDRRILLLYAGRFSQEKGLDILRQCMAILNESLPRRFHLVLVGDGPLKESLKDWARTRDDVSILGYMDKDDLARVYASCHLFVTPGRSETFGLSILEAQASGIPVVATNSGAAQDLVFKEAGALVRLDDANELAQAIMDLSYSESHLDSSIKRLHQNGLMARKWVEERFTWDHTFQSLFDIYRKLTAGEIRATESKVTEIKAVSLAPESFCSQNRAESLSESKSAPQVPLKPKPWSEPRSTPQPEAPPGYRSKFLPPAIRRYRPSDRQSVRDICAGTGLLGEPISFIFSKYEFFVDYLTRYYTDEEPDSCFVVTNGDSNDAEVVGYLIGCTDQKRYARYQAKLIPRLIFPAILSILKWRLLGWRFLKWLIFRGWRELPKAPAGGAHFHFNILKPWRSVASTRRLVDAFVDMVRKEHGEIGVVWGQMETMGARGSQDLFARLGWKFYDQVRLTKYECLFGGRRDKKDTRLPPDVARKISGDVFLTTICRDIPR